MNTIEIAIFQKQKSKKASGKCHPCCNFVPQSRRLLTSDPDPDVFEIGLKIGERFEFPSISSRQSLISSPLAKKNPASETSPSSTVDSQMTRNSIPRSSSTMSTPNYLVKDKKNKWKPQILFCAVVDYLLYLMRDSITMHEYNLDRSEKKMLQMNIIKIAISRKYWTL